MSAVPLHVLTRPFAIEPVTQIMLPDGIFDNALYNLQIACHYTNNSTSELTNVSLYLESVGDPGIVVTAKTHHFARIPAGASVMVRWDANFQHASPGKRLVSFVAAADEAVVGGDRPQHEDADDADGNDPDEMLHVSPPTTDERVARANG